MKGLSGGHLVATISYALICIVKIDAKRKCLLVFLFYMAAGLDKTGFCDSLYANFLHFGLLPQMSIMFRRFAVSQQRKFACQTSPSSPSGTLCEAIRKFTLPHLITAIPMKLLDCDVKFLSYKY